MNKFTITSINYQANTKTDINKFWRINQRQKNDFDVDYEYQVYTFCQNEKVKFEEYAIPGKMTFGKFCTIYAERSN